MKKILTISLILLLTLSESFARENSSLFGFRGKVFTEDGGRGGVTVNLYDGNKKVSSYKTGMAGKFILDIARNRYYTLEFVKEGFVTKRVAINTKVNHKDAVGVKEYKFDVELLKEEPGIDYSDLDFPITILEFEKSKKEFVINKKYTTKMLEAQDRIVRYSGGIAQK